MEYEKIIERIESLSNPDAVKGMERYGIKTMKVYGVSIPHLKTLAREIGQNHEIALTLWSSNTRETRIFASMLDDPEIVDESQMEEWVKGFDNWEVCDQCCINLFRKTKYAYKKVSEWSSREEEFVKRAAFVLIACLAVHDKKADDAVFEKFFPLIIKEATDERLYTKKAVNWALRQIGKRSFYLNRITVEKAKEIQKMDSKSAQWIGSDALRELTSGKIQERFKPSMNHNI